MVKQKDIKGLLMLFDQ